MRFIYKIGIHVFAFLIFLATPFNIKARRWINGRRGIWKKIRKNLHEGDKIIWVHCASLGEFEQGRPVIEEIRERRPDFKILLTFFSPSGYELRKNYNGVDCVTYLPIDTRFNAWKFMNLVKPKAIFFIKYEFWYYFLRTAFRKKIPVFLVSAKFRRDQVFFKWYGLWYRTVLTFFSHLFVQDEGSRKYLRLIGIENVTITGDTRFDRVYQISQRAADYPSIKFFKGSSRIIVAGSTWEKDEQILIEYINQSPENVKFIIACHEINERRLVSIIAKIESPVIRFTDNEKAFWPEAKVLLIDTIGHLSAIYRYGDLAYIGGGFGKGIHNILEAATYGLPVVFGPNYKKFIEAHALIEKKAAFPISDFNSLKTVFDRLISSEELLSKCSGYAKNHIESKLGATTQIVDFALKKFG
jgi:3-deoxy-D-manno-octulosonic-acid transferase